MNAWGQLTLWLDGHAPSIDIFLTNFHIECRPLYRNPLNVRGHGPVRPHSLHATVPYGTFILIPLQNCTQSPNGMWQKELIDVGNTPFHSVISEHNAASFLDHSFTSFPSEPLLGHADNRLRSSDPNHHKSYHIPGLFHSTLSFNDGGLQPNTTSPRGKADNLVRLSNSFWKRPVTICRDVGKWGRGMNEGM